MPVSQACDKIQDGTHFSPQKQSDTGQYAYVTAKNVRPSGLDLSDLTYLDETHHRAIYGRCDVQPGDVLLVKDGVNTGDTCLNTLADEISLLSSVCFLRPNPALLRAAFLRYYLQSPLGQRQLTGGMSGTAIRRIVLRRIRELSVPFPALSEQDNIVAEIEKHLTRLAAAIASLERAQAKLKAYRASVLRAASQGVLVPTEHTLAEVKGERIVTGTDLVAALHQGGKGVATGSTVPQQSLPPLPIWVVLDNTWPST
jgi:type I restriction enzyme, S subunit